MQIIPKNENISGVKVQSLLKFQRTLICLFAYLFFLFILELNNTIFWLKHHLSYD